MESKMGKTIYASFADPSLAEKAAGALLDHGVRAEDISVVRSHDGVVETESYGTSSSASYTGSHTMGTDRDNDLKNAGDAAVGEAHVAGHKVAETGDRIVGGLAGTFGSDETAARYEVAAAQQESRAAADSAEAGREWNDATDQNRVGTANYAGDYPNDVNTTVNTSGTNYSAPVDGSGDTEAAAKHGISTTTAGDAGAGAVKGVAWGAGIGALAALASLVVPGFGLVLGGGALATALGGLAASAGAGAVAGAVTGYLKDQGVDEHVAQHYDNAIAGGGALLAVTLPSGDVSEEEGRSVMEKYGASNVNAYESRGYLA
jgi:hypothetical protein